MKLGLLADIHERVDRLQAAIDEFRRRHVDRIVVLGDVFETGQSIRQTCELLAAADTVGVWGNHDFGLCVNPTAELRQNYGETVIRYMTSLKPRLDVAGCHFTHVEPWLNPEELLDLWYFKSPIDRPGNLQRIFGAVPNRLMFAGHTHHWALTTPEGLVDWEGERPVTLADGRHFIVLAAVCDGYCAVFDSGTCELVPIRV